MRVAQIRLGAAVIHDAVVALGGRNQPRVLGGVQETTWVAGSIIELLFQDVLALPNNLLLAFAEAFGEHGAAIGGGFALPRNKATTALARHRRRFRIDLVEER